jgi:hypothetical protein
VKQQQAIRFKGVGKGSDWMACEMLKHNGFIVVDEIRDYRRVNDRSPMPAPGRYA